MQKACHKSCHMCQMYVELVKINRMVEYIVTKYRKANKLSVHTDV